MMPATLRGASTNVAAAGVNSHVEKRVVGGVVGRSQG